ncbi:ATP-binding protein [Streptomyces parvulus]|uniref:ATP-binding protein n=1 Tax=Streptomyces parvulus TaxID=146923 RepID=UPI001E394656|nr:ATP-binding protein [Streptomyces parvulus]MCC9154565.1 ATP-binding protein [Streptomyces parvulus]MCE7689326.1 ATP-binding protein [Streptomyces parvulus]
MTAPARPGDRPAPRTLVAVALPCAVAAALAVGGVVAAAPSSARLPVGLGAGAAAILLCVAVTVAVHAVRGERRTRRLLDAARADADALARERGQLAERARQERERLRAEADREQADVVTAADRERAALLDGFARERDQLAAGFEQERARLAERHAAETARLAEENEGLRTRLDRARAERAAAVSATANAAGRMQALATGMLADLRAMEERHSDEDVLTDLLHLDHRTAQAGRLADSVAVLTGARSGRRWARPIGMESILRGAMGRIAGYQRVRVHSASDTAVAGHAAEGVMHALAELLDNAANFSPPTAEVHVYVEAVPAGAIVSVEDSGLVMGEVQLRRAQRAVAGDAAGLGGLTGTRLGLAVVGRLSAKYGLKVSFRPSARGGTGVLMLIPQDILTGSGSADAPAAARPVAASAGPRRDAVADGAAPDGPGREPASAGAPAEVASVTGTAPARAATGAEAGSAASGPEHASATGSGEEHGPVSAHTEPPAAAAPGGSEPSPTHDLAEEDADEGAGGLPKRRRGRTLAAAERTRSAARAAEPRPAPAADDAKVRAARFSSFRQAVRSADTGASRTGSTPVPDGAAPAEPSAPTAPASRPAPDDAATDHPSHSPAHPEGDTTS